MGCNACGYETGNHGRGFCSVDDREEIPHLRARIAALESQLAQYRWRRVEDEIPEVFDSVLIPYAKSVIEAFIDPEGEWWLFRIRGQRVLGVRHWMPLPPAPGEGE